MRRITKNIERSIMSKLNYSQNNIRIRIIFSIIFLLSMNSCMTHPPLKWTQKQDMDFLKYYERTFIPANRPPWKTTNIFLEKGDEVVLFVSGIATDKPRHFKRLYMKIGDGIPRSAVWSTNQRYSTATESGQLMFAVADWISPYDIVKERYKDNSGGYTCDIFVFHEEDKSKFPILLKELAVLNAQDSIFQSHVSTFLRKFGSSQ